MRFVQDERHPRILKDGKKILIPICKSRTGWHCCCRGCRKSDLSDLGVGVTVYFKMLKYLMLLFLWFTILSIPAMIFYESGDQVKTEKLSLKNILSSFSLGNIGQASSSCDYDLAEEGI